jgi:flavin-dependent dehydrogenase
MAEPIDAVVVGAGPAGSAAATVLASGGLSTVLLAGNRTPTRHWTETVPASLDAILPKLGLAAQSLQSVGAPCRWHAAEHVSFHVDRRMFDALLRQAAVHAGARLIESKASSMIHLGGKVAGVQTASGEAIHSRMVIDATGARAQLSRRLTSERRDLSPPLVAWRAEVRGIPEGMADDEARLVSCNDGRLFLATWRGRTTWTFVGHDLDEPDLPADIAALPVTIRPTAWNCGWRLARPVAGPGWLLAGEAAGRLDPTWGQGLLSAMASGMAAGRAVCACLADPDNEAIYLASYEGSFVDSILEAAESLRSRDADNRPGSATCGATML